MATVTYTKSLSSDFGGSLNQAQFQQEVANSAIVPNILSVGLKGDVVSIVFDSSLSVGEQTILNTLISNHDPSPTKYNEHYYLVDQQYNTYVEFGNTVAPVALLNYEYPGYINCGNICDNGRILHNGKYTGSGTYYSINFILRDMTNAVDMINVSITGSSGFNNQYYYTPQTYQLPPLQNIPTGPALLQASYNLDVGSRGRIYSVQLL